MGKSWFINACFLFWGAAKKEMVTVCFFSTWCQRQRRRWRKMRKLGDKFTSDICGADEGKKIYEDWRVHSHRCVWLNFSQINKFTLPEGRERGLKIREACSIPLTLLSDEEISRLNKSLMMLAGKLWKWLKATLRWGVLLLRKITFPLKSCLYSGQVLSWTNRF